MGGVQGRPPPAPAARARSMVGRCRRRQGAQPAAHVHACSNPPSPTSCPFAPRSFADVPGHDVARCAAHHRQLPRARVGVRRAGSGARRGHVRGELPRELWLAGRRRPAVSPWVAAVVGLRGGHATCGRWLLGRRLDGLGDLRPRLPAGRVSRQALSCRSVWQALRSRARRARLARFLMGLVSTVAVATALAVVVFGADSFRVFAVRLARDAGVPNVLHIGLDKDPVLYRSWVRLSELRRATTGLMQFRAMERAPQRDLDGTSVVEAGTAQLAVMILAIRGARVLRRPLVIEAAVLVGVTGTFTLASPASYYYVILRARSGRPLARRDDGASVRSRDAARSAPRLRGRSGSTLCSPPQLIGDPIIFDLGDLQSPSLPAPRSGSRLDGWTWGASQRSGLRARGPR